MIKRDTKYVLLIAPCFAGQVFSQATSVDVSGTCSTLIQVTRLKQ